MGLTNKFYLDDHDKEQKSSQMRYQRLVMQGLGSEGRREALKSLEGISSVGRSIHGTLLPNPSACP